MPLDPRIRVGDHGFEVAQPAPYSDEKHLEGLVREHPWRVLPWEDFGGDDALPPLVVGQKVGLGPSGVADLIAVPEDGYLTVIECKLDRNAEVRRSVIGQILGYASYLRDLTPEEFEAAVIRPYFDRNDGVRGLTLADGVGHLIAEARRDAGASPADWSKVNLGELPREPEGRQDAVADRRRQAER